MPGSGGTEPLSHLVIGILACGEPFTGMTAAGMVLVIVAVSWVVLNNASGSGVRRRAGAAGDR